jgi:hypothetical protein
MSAAVTMPAFVGSAALAFKPPSAASSLAGGGGSGSDSVLSDRLQPSRCKSSHWQSAVE